MKKIIATILLLGACIGSYAQKYQPRDTWPYINYDFLDGAVRTASGLLITEGKYNVSVSDASLHYIKDGVIMKADMSGVYTAVAGNMFFVNIGGKMYLILSENENGALLQLTTLDLDKMGQVSIGYGIKSASASANDVSALVQNLDGVLNTNVDNLKLQRENGNELPVMFEKFIYVKNRLVPATRQSIRDCPGIDKAQADAFFKENKIKWTKNESLVQLVDFVAAQLND